MRLNGNNGQASRDSLRNAPLLGTTLAELALPTRVVRAHLYDDAGVTTAEGMTDRVELAVAP